MDIVLVRISIDMIRHHDRHILGRKRFIWLKYSHITVHHQRKLGLELKQGRILDAVADAEGIEGCLLTCFQ